MRTYASGPGYACRVSTPVSIAELGRPAFLANIDAQLDIYTAAMVANPGEVPGRRAIMERHAGNPGLRSLVAVEDGSGRIVGFAYGFRGVPGQWWHDVVRSEIVATAGQASAEAWLASALEVAEVHVHPEFQQRGIGRQMILMLTADRTERTAVLSTRDANTPARRLYRQLGFADLLTAFQFPGGGPPYAVMGAPLPLPGATDQPG
jgi:ribosomal protein S18 acetylase RimI-like enzyme